VIRSAPSFHSSVKEEKDSRIYGGIRREIKKFRKTKNVTTKIICQL